MSDHHQLHNPALFNAQSVSRLSDASMMPMPVYAHPNQRVDALGVAQNIAQVPGAPYIQYCHVRTPEQIPFFYRSQMYYAVPQNISEAQLQGAPVPVPDYGHIPAYPQNPFSQGILNNQTMQPTLIQRPVNSLVPEESTIKIVRPRSKCPLAVTHPVTGAVVDLINDVDSSPILTSNEAIDSISAVIVEENGEKPIDTKELLLPDCSTETNEECEQNQYEEAKLVPVNEALDSDSNDHSSKVGSTEADEDNGALTEIDEADDDLIYVRQIYSREELLSYKNSPVARIELPELSVIANIYPQKGQRSVRPSQRVIRLPTAITIKKVEGAFVPTSLKKKNDIASNDDINSLTRELNMILNRMSDGNFKETMLEIKRINFKSPEELNLFSELVFQKGIRQSKYSKVFAKLCKELKGFDVPGSKSFENLLLRFVHDLFNTPLDALIKELNISIDAKIASAKDESIKVILEEDRDTCIIKKKEAYDGNITLLGELYLCRIVTLRTITDCLKKLTESTAPEAMRSMIILLNVCGQDLDQKSKSVVDMCFERLDAILESNKLQSHEVYKIQELQNLRLRGWKELDPSMSRMPQQDATSKRHIDDRNRRSNQFTSDFKRKSVHSGNVAPPTLTVTQHSVDPRKLGPTNANWHQGSGQLAQGPISNSLCQAARLGQTLPPINRSHEGSPSVPFGPQGVWAVRQATSTAQNTPEEYGAILERIKGPARSFVATLRSIEDNYASVENCKKEHRAALIHAVLELLMDKSSEDRAAAGRIFLEMLKKKLLEGTDFISACQRYLPNCNDDWLEDYPFGPRYIAEIFQHFIQDEQDYFYLIPDMLKSICISEKSASILAHIMHLSAQRLNNDLVLSKFRSQALDWTKFGIAPENVRSFTETHGVTFTQSSNVPIDSLEKLGVLAASKIATPDQLNDFFKQLSTFDLPKDFVRLCTQTLIERSRDFNRNMIDKRVVALSILVDHDHDREMQVLDGWYHCLKGEASNDNWFKAFVSKRVLSSGTCDDWSKANNFKESIIKTLRIPD